MKSKKAATWKLTVSWPLASWAQERATHDDICSDAVGFSCVANTHSVGTMRPNHTPTCSTWSISGVATLAA
eukprot:893026-Prymnesium_polylepis.2